MKLSKYKIAKLSAAVCLSLVILGSCKKGYLDINQNPNSAVEENIEPYALLPGALNTTANSVGTGYVFLMRWLGFVATSAGVAPSAEEESYNITTTFSTGSFNNVMDNAYDYQVMENKARAKGQTFYLGVAKIMKSFCFARVVDAYNSIPYTEALQGLAHIAPKYDEPKTIYEDLIKQIDSGITYIKGYDIGANPNAKTADIMFGSEISGTTTTSHKTQWVKFANTLKLRILMHQSNRADRATYIQSEITKIVTEGSGFLVSNKSASVNPGYSQAQPNNYYATFAFTTTGADATQTRANKVVMGFLKADSDPRLGYFYRPVATALPAGNAEPFVTPVPVNYRSNAYGLAIDNAIYKNQTRAYVSKVGGVGSASASSATSTGIIKGWDMRAWIITSIESLFLQAEAIAKGYMTGDAQTAYKNAVLESFIWLNVDASTTAATTNFNSWYASSSTNANVSYAAATDKVKLIAYQKYLTMVELDPLETWTDYRRNGAYPVIELSYNTARTSSKLPIRLLYPDTEINYNTANVPAKGRVAGEQFSESIWWMP